MRVNKDCFACDETHTNCCALFPFFSASHSSLSHLRRQRRNSGVRWYGAADDDGDAIGGLSAKKRMLHEITTS